MIKNIKKMWKRNKHIRKTIKELNALSDRDLADIGIYRSDIRSIAKKSA